MSRAVLYKILFLFVFFIAFFFALPWSNVAQPEPKNSCTTVLPSLMIPIYSTAPALVSQTSTMFLVSQEPSQDLFCDCLLSFVVPWGSTSCQLELRLPNGYQSDWLGPREMYFWNVAEPFDSSCCWIDAPDITDLFGSVILQANMSYAIVNSFLCESLVSFRVGMNRFGAAGSCSFEQTKSEGLILTYGC